MIFLFCYKAVNILVFCYIYKINLLYIFPNTNIISKMWMRFPNYYCSQIKEMMKGRIKSHLSLGRPLLVRGNLVIYPNYTFIWTNSKTTKLFLTTVKFMRCTYLYLDLKISITFLIKSYVEDKLFKEKCYYFISSRIPTLLRNLP